MLSQEGVINAIERIYDLYDRKIADLEKELGELKNARDAELRFLQTKCPHVEIDIENYIDYDRNQYTIVCSDCGKTLLYSGDWWDYTSFLKSRLNSKS